MKVLILILLGGILGGCENSPRVIAYKETKANKIKYASEIRETTKECLSNIRQNPSVQNFNDDNEVVETCTKYAMELYNAHWE